MHTRIAHRNDGYGYHDIRELLDKHRELFVVDDRNNVTFGLSVKFIR